MRICTTPSPESAPTFWPVILNSPILSSVMLLAAAKPEVLIKVSRTSMPSCTRLLLEPRSPFMIDEPAVAAPVDVTPAICVAKSSGLRVVEGRSIICLRSTWVFSSLDVLSTGGWTSSTVTTSLAPPTTRFALKLESCAVTTWTPVASQARKPAMTIFTEYFPKDSPGMVKVPSLAVFTVNTAPVASSVAVTAADETTAPCGSNTVPDIEPRCTCAAQNEAASNHTANSSEPRYFMSRLPFLCGMALTSSKKGANIAQ